ncbi:MAG TPA: hypothetical protein GXX22_02800 [Clostridiales bacterium]|nr:hypothetical protein [Clostridiales bacterium]
MLCFEGFCEYAKISDPADNTARLCYDAAVQAAKDAGVPGWLFERGHPVLELFVYALALHWYDNRGFTPLVTLETLDEYSKRVLNGMLCSLRYLSEPEEG